MTKMSYIRVIFGSAACLFGILTILFARSCAVSQVMAIARSEEYRDYVDFIDKTQQLMAVYLVIGGAVLVAGIVAMTVFLTRRQSE